MKSTHPGLRKLAAEAGLSIGCHPDWQDRGETWGPVYLLQREFDTLVSNAFHWCALQPEGPGKWDWSRADRAVALAHDIGLELRGHAILWYQMLPGWFTGPGTRREKESYLVEHVHTLVDRYRGVVKSWDVLNEALWLSDGRAGGLRNDPLLALFGESYIDLAFHAAAEADPGAELVLNEALLVHEEQQPRREAFLGLVESLLHRGVPVHAAGIQAHIGWDDGLPMGVLTPEATAELIRNLGGAGVTCKVTELDVFDVNLSKNPARRDEEVAEIYGRFLDGVLQADFLSGVYFWGCGDRSSWYNSYVRRVMPERLPGPDWEARPLLFDRDYQPKPACFAVARALQRASLGASEKAFVSSPGNPAA